MSSKPPPRARSRDPRAHTSVNRGGGTSSARERLAVQREIQSRKRRRLLWVVLPVALVVVAAGALVAVRLLDRGPTAGASPSATAGENQVIAAVTSVPSSVLDQVGAGSATTPPVRVQGPALTERGKPRVLYVGAEYCPYCAAERWAMVVALSRFGTFSRLGQTASSAGDVFPSTPTLSFHGSTFTSPTVAFTGVETEGNQLVNGQYAPLDTLSAADQQLFATYDAPPYSSPAGSIPFVDIGGRYLVSGASYSPQVLHGQTHQQVAAALSDPTSPIAQGVDGAANVITAAICASTGDSPATVCRSAGVQAAAKKLS